MDLLAEIKANAERVSPPLAILRSTEWDSFDNVTVELQDADVVWQFLRERSIVSLGAAPVWETDTFYDDDLLTLLVRAQDGPRHATNEWPVSPTVAELFARLEGLRAPVAEAFNRVNWEESRKRLATLVKRRNAEIFGLRTTP